VADGFEQVEMTEPREALDGAGAETKIVSLKPGKFRGCNTPIKATNSMSIGFQPKARRHPGI
jgi:putative intracellular protease/amidase